MKELPWAKEIGLTPTEVGRKLKLSQPGANRATNRGAELAASRGWNLKELMQE